MMQEETKSSGHSSFQLNQTKLTLKPLTLSPSNIKDNDSDSLSPASSLPSPDSIELSSPKPLLSPFTLNVKKSVGLSSSSSFATNHTSLLASTSLLRDSLTPEQKVIELNKEIIALKKDIEAKDAKLSSSVKSIKQFWSPELKKERAHRKEETERCLIFKEKLQIANSQIEEYKNTLEDLESELSSQQLQIKSLTEEVKSLQISNADNNETQNKLRILENENSKLQEQINIYEGDNKIYLEAIRIRDETIDKMEENLKSENSSDDDRLRPNDEIFVLSKTLDDIDLKYKQLEDELGEKERIICELESSVKENRQSEDENQSELDILCKTLGLKEDENLNLEKELKRTQRELQQLQKKYEELQHDVAGNAHDTSNEELVKSQEAIDSLQTELEANIKDLNFYKNQDEENKNRIAELESLISAKNRDYDGIHLEKNSYYAQNEVNGSAERIQQKLQLSGQLTSLKKELEEIQKASDTDTLKDTEIKKLKLEIEDKIKELTNSQHDVSRLEIELQGSQEDLRTNEKKLLNLEIDIKKFKSEILSSQENEKKLKENTTKLEKDLQDQKRKYEKLDKYVSERETALEAARGEVKELKIEINKLTLSNGQLENDLYEYKAQVTRLERQKETLTKKASDHVSIESYNKLKESLDQMNKKYEESQKELEEKKREISSHQKTIEDLQSELSEINEKLENLADQNKELTATKESLSKELDSSNQKLKDMEIFGSPSTDDRPSSPVKGSSKHLWDELAKKEAKIEELEKQLKEKGKQIASLKKSQTIDREKQHQDIAQNKKNEEEISNQVKELKDLLATKEQRITMLEDAVRESVIIASEREDILARHVELSEENAERIVEVEAEYDRITLEKSITNIKNAFLILSLSEKDALVASMKAARKRYLEELFNMKQEILLAAISEKDNQIGHLELQNSKNRRTEIKQLKSDKEQYVKDLKEQNNQRMRLLNDNEEKENLLLNELREAPPEQVYEAIRHLSTSIGKLEFYIDELVSYFSEKQYDVLKDLSEVPQRKNMSFEELKKAPKEELLKQLQLADADSVKLKDYVSKLLDKLQG